MFVCIYVCVCVFECMLSCIFINLFIYNYNTFIDIINLFRRPMLWTMFVWKNENWRTDVMKSKPPHNFLIGKGSTHAAASRAFVDFALNDPRARDLLEWMKDIRAPDEHFFPTLNHNPVLGIPGSYKGLSMDQYSNTIKSFQVVLCLV